MNMDFKELELPADLPSEFEEYHWNIIRKTILDKKPGIHVLSDDLTNNARKNEIFRFIQWVMKSKMDEKGIRKTEKHFIPFIIDDDRYRNIKREDTRVIPITFSTIDTTEIDTTQKFIEELQNHKNKVNSTLKEYVRRKHCNKTDVGKVIYYPTLMAQIARANIVNTDPSFIAYNEAKKIFHNDIVISIQDNSFIRK